MKINAILKTLSPLHIAAPGDTRADPSTGRKTSDKTKTPLISIQRMPVVNPRFSPSVILQPIGDETGDDSESMMAGIEPEATETVTPKEESAAPEKGQDPVIQVPVVAANNIAGHLRRHAASLVIDALRARGETVSLPVYSCLQSGAWTGRPGSEDMTYGEYIKASQHPYLGLFGGGPRMMRKGFKTRDALPALPWLRESLRRDVVDHAGPAADIPSWNLTKIAFFRRNDDLADLVGITQAQQCVTSFDSVFEAYQQSILADKAETQQARTSTFTFSALEFVIPGVSFDCGFDLRDDLTDAQVGLFLLSLDRFAERDTLGGAVRNGFGQVVFDAVELDGEPVFSNGRLNRSNPDVQTYIAAWEDAASKMTVAELEYLFRPGEKSKEGKKKDKAAAGKPKVETPFERLQRVLAASA